MEDGTFVPLTPFHMGEPGRMAGQTNNNNNQSVVVIRIADKMVYLTTLLLPYRLYYS